MHAAPWDAVRPSLTAWLNLSWGPRGPPVGHLMGGHSTPLQKDTASGRAWVDFPGSGKQAGKSERPSLCCDVNYGR